MASEITVPDLGESVYEATVANWLKKEGDRVTVGEAVVELETDKVDLEVGATENGVLKSIKVQEGEDVQVGEVLAIIEAVEGKEPEAPEEPNAEEERQPVKEEMAEEKVEEKVELEEVEKEEETGKVTPVAWRLAQESGVDLEKVSGTGAGGRITKEDVERYLEKEERRPEPEARTEPEKVARPKPAERVEPGPPARPLEELEERMRMSRRRRTIAERLVEAQRNAAMLTTFNDVDMSAVIDTRQRRRESFQEKYGIKLGFMSFFVKASIGALKEFPRLNAEIEGDDIILKYHYDIGIAIGAEEGLVVPVLRNADRMTFAEIEKKIAEYIEKVRDKTLTIEDLQGGTFTITNGGVFGSLLSTPILNPPQVGILGMHRIEDRPTAKDGQVIIRPMMYLALSYDHRIVDGREAVLFLYRIKQLIEDPVSLLLEG
jgi:2-oxoglutarate dehydrogenase E2 component (dihydrolipoamide succinyltransferase)